MNSDMPEILYVNEPEPRPDGSLMYEADAGRFHAKHKYIRADLADLSRPAMPNEVVRQAIRDAELNLVEDIAGADVTTLQSTLRTLIQASLSTQPEAVTVEDYLHFLKSTLDYYFKPVGSDQLKFAVAQVIAEKQAEKYPNGLIIKKD